MEWHGHFDLGPILRTKVLEVGAATIDRKLTVTHLHIDLRHSIPVCTFSDWRDPPPDFFGFSRIQHWPVS